MANPSDDDGEDQRHQARAQVKERTHKINKKPAAGEQQPAASPSSLRKKPAASKKRQKVTYAAPAPIPAPNPAAADDVCESIKVASDSPPKHKPVHSSKSHEPPSAAASQQLRSEKKRKQQQDGASAREGEAAAAAAAASAGGLSSKKPFERVWAEDDEIALLEAMVSHSAASDISVAVGGKFSKKQIFEKLRKLKKKYKKHLRWGEKGTSSSFVNSHDQHVFELSKKLWPTMQGDAHDYIDGDEGVRTNGEGGKIGGHRLEQTYPMLGNALHLLEEDGDNLLARSASRAPDTTKLKALESQWEKHFKAGVQYCLQHARMKGDLLELIVKFL